MRYIKVNMSHARARMGGQGAAEASQCNPNRCAAPDSAEESQAEVGRATVFQSNQAQDRPRTTLFPVEISIFCPTGGGTKFGMVLLNGLMTASHIVKLTVFETRVRSARRGESR